MKPLLIVPAGGLSSRYKADKPKWLHTHPDGKLMIQHSLKTFELITDLEVYLVTTEQVAEKYDVEVLLANAFQGEMLQPKLIKIPAVTPSAVHTVLAGLKRIPDLDESRPLYLKDTDNKVLIPAMLAENKFDNFSVGVHVAKHPNLQRISNKSFFKVTDFDFISDMFEKTIVSDIISVGTHKFSSVSMFMQTAIELISEQEKAAMQDGGELYISHVVSSLIYKGIAFKYIEATHYKDYGTGDDWRAIQERHGTYFVDWDGCLVKNKGRYGQDNWFKEDEVIEGNMQQLKQLYKEGATIVITTSRILPCKPAIERVLAGYGIVAHSIITGLPHAPRTLINDYAPTNQFPSARALSIPRNGNLSHFLG